MKMKSAKIRTALMAALMLLSALPVMSQVVFNATNFPDANFRSFLKTTHGFPTEGSTVTKTKLESVTQIDCSGKSISNLTGIRYFTKLEQLLCKNNSLTSLSALPATLKILDCSRNSTLTSLNVAANTNLTRLWVEDCSLTSVDITKLTALKELSLKGNKLTSLDLTKCTELLWIYLGGNSGLSGLNFDNNNKVQILSIYSTAQTSLSLANHPGLLNLSCWGCSNMETVDLSGSADLRVCNLGSTKIKALDLSNNLEIRHLRCENAKLTTLDLSRQTKLWKLNCSNNSLTELDLSKCVELDTKTTTTYAELYGQNATFNESQTQVDSYVSGGSNYRGQVRYVPAQTFKITVKDNNSTISTIHYYFRLDETKTTANESTLVETMTAGNYGNVASAFKSASTTWVSGGTVVIGQCTLSPRKVQTPNGNVTDDQVVGNILLLTSYTEENGTASGTVTYTYDVGYGTPSSGAFTLNWSASADPDQIVTGIEDLTGAQHGRPVTVTYHNLAGMASDRPFTGMNIVTTRYGDGTVTVSKMLK